MMKPFLRQLRFIKRLLIMLCAIGCLIHLVLVTTRYFRYQTLMIYAPYIALEQNLPHVSLCFLHQLNSSRFLMETQVASCPAVDQIKQSAVDVSLVMRNCRMRSSVSGEVKGLRDCSSVFTVARTRRKNYDTCYTLSAINNTIFRSLETVTAMSERGTLFSFSLSDGLSRQNIMLVALHYDKEPREKDFHSIDIAYELKKRNESFSMFGSRLKIFRLPSPYETKCGKNSNLCEEVLTRTHACRVEQELEQISIEIRSLNSPTELVKYIPRMQGSNLFIEICSILAFWCSLSINFLVSSVFSGCSSNHAKLTDIWYAALVTTSRKAKIDLMTLRQSVEHSVSHSMPAARTGQVMQSTGKFIIFLIFTREMMFIGIDYFQYNTRMEIDVEINAATITPSISHCLDIVQWVELEKPLRYYNTYDRVMSNFSRRFNFTLHQLFHSLPQAAVRKCRIRDKFTGPLITRHNCTQYFEVQKFYHSLFMCYNFKPRMRYHLDNRSDTATPSILYSLVMQEALTRPKHFQIIVSHGLPTLSRFLANRLFRERKKELVITSFVMYHYEKLPVPHDTNCDPKDNYDNCRINCFASFNLPFLQPSELYSEPVKKRLISYNDMKNETFAKLARETEVTCDKLCRGNCNYFATKTIHRLGYTSNESLEIALTTSQYPLYIFRAVPVVTFNSCLYQMACCASFWVGFSILAIVRCLTTRGAQRGVPRHAFLLQLTRRLEKAIRIKFNARGDRKQLSKPSDEESKRKSRSRVKNCLYSMMLASGFSLHTFTTAQYYFQYPTRLDSRYEFEKNVTDVKVTVCISLDQLDLKDNFTLQNIWSQSPREHEVILECGHRGLKLPKLAHLPTILQQRILPYINSTSLCNSLFKLNKFVKFGMVCYEVTPSVDVSDALWEARYHPESMKVYQYFTLRRKLSQYNLTIAMSREDDEALMIFDASIGSTNPSHNQWFWFSYIKFQIRSLSYPYQAGVFNSLDQIHCSQKCVAVHTRSSLHRISSYDRADLAETLVHETLNGSITPPSIAIKRKCLDKCNHCKSIDVKEASYFETYYDGPYDDDYNKVENGTNGLWFRNSDYLVAHTRLFPSLRLLDLVLYTGTIYSIWFGISALQTIDSLCSRSPSPLSKWQAKQFCEHALRLQILLPQQKAPSKPSNRSIEP